MPEPTDRAARLRAIFDAHAETLDRTRTDLLPVIEELSAALCDALGVGNKLVVFGNGGSAADAQHLAAELMGHFVTDRGPLPAVALTVDSSALTAIGNDYGFAEVFARQASALCRPGDIALGISTSGRAENVVRGVEAAKVRGARTYGLTGGTGGRLVQVADRSIVVPSSETARIQEMHITIIHAVCALVDDWAASRKT